MAKGTRLGQKFVENGVTSKLSKSASGKTQLELHPIPKVEIPWHTIHIDIHWSAYIFCHSIHLTIRLLN